MSLLQPTTENNTPSSPRCIRCGAILPLNATFCSRCGERVEQITNSTSSTSSNNVSNRYRITSLLRRRPYIQLFLAEDHQFHRPVVIRDIEVSSLDEEKQAQSLEVSQQEYDVLRRQHIPDITPLIDLRFLNGHIFVVGGWPFPLEESESNGKPDYRPHTLHDLLQSGIGLPDEKTALAWIQRLCTALERLHEQHIFVGNLDPSTIVVSNTSYTGRPALVVSWLPNSIHTLLPLASDALGIDYFSAPEVAQGRVDPRSDIYSVGALLYLLLTGRAPELAVHTQQPLHSPRDINMSVTPGTDAVVTHALSEDPVKRFQNVAELSQALAQLLSDQHVNRQVRKTVKFSSSSTPAQKTAEEPPDDPEEVTVSVAPLKAQMARWQLSRIPTGKLAVVSGKTSQTKEISPASTQAEEEKPAIPENVTPEPLPEPMPRETQQMQQSGPLLPIEAQPTMVQRLKEQLSGVLPALPRHEKANATQPPASTSSAAPVVDEERSFLRRLQRFLLGEQKRSTTAAALIETPLRVQPNQYYTIRIHLMGRDAPIPPPGSKPGTPAVGLSSMARDEIVHIEVRSALYHNYAYIVQRADVSTPAQGFAAEVAIPMQSLSEGKSGRRERLHIFFTDELRRPLYEKPFVVEIFISHLVQSGREGHNVLTIPL